MGDKRKNNGGARIGAGRRPKADELKFLERLDNVIDKDDAIEKLKEFIIEGNFNALKLYLEYRFGKPKETIDNNIYLNEKFDIKDIYKVEET